MAGWMDRLTVADVVLIAVLLAVNLYLWVNLVAEVIEWRRRLTANRSPKPGPRPPARDPVPLLVTALGTGLTSVWMLVVLLPLF